jgi:hypothetical protein
VDAEMKTGEAELEKFLAKPSVYRNAASDGGKIRVVWPSILSSGCSTWLSTRKAESDKKQAEKETVRASPWLVRDGEDSSVDLAREVREGLLRAGNMQAKETSEESRIPLPVSEENVEDVEMAGEPLSLSTKVKLGLLRAGSVCLPAAPDLQAPKSSPKPWRPKSLAEEVKKGLLRAGGDINDEIDSEEDLVLLDDETIEPEYVSTDGPLESFADTLRRSFMNISFEQPKALPGNLTGSRVEPRNTNKEESVQESLDNWIMDDNQSEGASIVTLDTFAESVDMEDFDDFKDIKNELRMWISKD